MSSPDPLDEALHSDDPVAVPGLEKADRARLAVLVTEARARQRAALDDAIEGGLGHLPRLVRGSVKAMLFR